MTFSPRSIADVSASQTLALFPAFIVAGWSNAVGVSLILVVAAITAVLWEMVFAGVRKRAFTGHGLTTALVVTLFCPVDVAPWQLAIAVSLGVLFGELIYGGRGFGFVSPAALSLSLLIVAFPEVALRAPTPEVALAVLPGTTLLLGVGLISLNVMAGVALGTLGFLAITGYAIEPLAIVTALSVGTVFLIADPTSASATTLGRWVYGTLAGALVVVFSPGSDLTPEAVVAAALFASVFAPLIDHGAVLFHTRTKPMRRHG